MIGLDTNILVRVLVADDARQVRKVRKLFDRLDESGERAYVSDIVLCELAWVLDSCYGFTRVQIGRALHQLRAARQLTFDSPDVILRALRSFEAGKGDIADYLIAEHARRARCDSVFTFDKKLLREEGFSPPP